ncbi:MAG: alpha/beta hydrolase, partial [Acidimicrobiia bacterium]|nr:alpha/beta hydrolase [Acidimicrobiia bacterium]
SLAVRLDMWQVEAMTTTTPESKWVEANGLRLHYLDWGNPGARPLLLLHGLQDCAPLWQSFAGAIADRHHVVALDHRGHGDSPRADVYPVSDYVDEVADVVRRLGLEDLTLIGHSAGSKNAWMCVAQNPGIAKRLVITDMDPDSHNPGSVAMISRYKAEDDEYSNIDEVVARLRDRQPNASEKETRYDAEVMTTTMPNGKLTWKRSRDVVTRYDRPDVWDVLPQVAVPTLIVRGADSTLLRHDVAVRMEAAIPDCRLVEIPGGGHWIHLEQPSAYLQAVGEFLVA